MRGAALAYVNSQPWAVTLEHLEVIRSIADHATPEMVAARAAKPMDGGRKVGMRGSTAVIPVRGTIMRYGNLYSDLCPNGATSLDILSTDIQAALDNPAVEAIVLEIDSPGGQASGVGELASRIYAARGTKPMCAYVSSMGASAAYYLASACDRVVCSPMSIVGSIGVICSVDTREKAGEMTIRSSQSPNKAPSPSTAKGQASVQSQVDAMAAVFIADVARFRGISGDDVIEKYGAGGVCVGQAAVDCGMADEIGDLESCIACPSKSISANSNHSASGATPDPDPEEPMPSLRAQLTAWLNELPEAKASEAVYVASAPPIPEPATPPPVAPNLAAHTREILTGVFATAADAYLDGLVGNLIVPAEKAGLAAEYLDLALSDATSPLLVAGAPVARLGRFKAGLEARRPLNLTAETLGHDATDALDKLAEVGTVVLERPAVSTDLDEAARSAATIARMKEGGKVPRMSR